LGQWWLWEVVPSRRSRALFFVRGAQDTEIHDIRLLGDEGGGAGDKRGGEAIDFEEEVRKRARESAAAQGNDYARRPTSYKSSLSSVGARARDPRARASGARALCGSEAGLTFRCSQRPPPAARRAAERPASDPGGE
jgi:hypothetical protein